MASSSSPSLSTSLPPYPLVSVIIPMHNAGTTIYQTLLSILDQDYRGSVEICMYNDASTDSTQDQIFQFMNEQLLIVPELSSSSTSTHPSPIDRTTVSSYMVSTVAGTHYHFPSSLFPRTTKGGGTVVVKYQTNEHVQTKYSHGPGFGRNRAVSFSTGTYLCLLDADDRMLPSRITWQLELAMKPLDSSELERWTNDIETYLPTETFSSSSYLSSSSSSSSNSSTLTTVFSSSTPYILVGGYFVRDPPDSMRSYTEWANNLLNDNDIYINSWRECSMIQPTWFMHRRVYESIGGYDEIVPKYLIDQYHKKSRTGGSQSGSAITQGTTTTHTSSLPNNQNETESSVTPSATIHAPSVSASTSVPVPPSADYPIANVLHTRELQWNALVSPNPNHKDTVHHPLHSTVDTTVVECGICPWSSTEQTYRHPPLLSYPPTKLDPSFIDDHTFQQYSFGEDPLFWHRHLARKGLLRIVRKPVTVYHYDPGSLSFRTPQATLLRVRTALFEERCLANRYLRIRENDSDRTTMVTSSPSTTIIHHPPPSTYVTEYTLPPLWQSFSIWNAGKDGKLFYNSLSSYGRLQMNHFFDIDPKKIGQHYPQVIRQPSSKTKEKMMMIPVHRTLQITEKDDQLVENTEVDEKGTKITLPYKRTYYQMDTDRTSSREHAIQHAQSTDTNTEAVDNGALIDPSSVEMDPNIRAQLANLTHPILPLDQATLPIVCCVSFKNGGKDLETNIQKVCGKTGAVLGQSILFMT